MAGIFPWKVASSLYKILRQVSTGLQGGATQFDHLGIAVKPKQGKALLFFPAYADGTPDER
jgi:hypothetical protein